MIQVHTVHESGTWRNKVDGLQQGPSYPTRSQAAAAAREVAVGLHAAHVVHDVDGSVLEYHRYGRARARQWVDPLLYRS